MMPPLERAAAFVTRGRRGPLSGAVVPSLVLHTIGARSGQPRESALMCCPLADGTILVTGSNFARPEHPAWTANLLAHPDAEIDFRGDRIPVRAELVPDDQREETWRLLEAQWPGYRGYERSSGRVLRIFRLTPR
ncbi:nitroreductase family deazaflavin-dependent oxidoreductase [Homoserinibacter sp. GY 40078]|nr:nitroreductase family deazaflavin-dependent oxidoreductase [Homoserinibacter sp. GY 40078]